MNWITLNWIEELRRRLQDEHLPGREAHLQLSAIEGALSTPPSNVRKAGVMALLFPSDRGWSICFIQRPSTNPRDPHSGQISFPGGRKEPIDKDLWDTASRETEEEIGVQSQRIQKIGSLSTLYIPISSYLVYPQVGFIDYKPDFQLQKSEVSSIITPPVEHLIEEDNIKYKDMKVRNNIQLKEVPHFFLDEHVIWGATAMMLNEFRHTLLRLDSEIK